MFSELFSDVLLHQFHYIDLKLNWLDAQHYCREKYDDLATIQSMEDIIQLKNQVRVSGNAWIGLRDDPNSWFKVMAWRWSDNSDISFRNWKEEQPYNYNEKNCVMSNEQYQWEDLNCKAELPFWCQEESGLCRHGHYLYSHVWRPRSDD
uniref:C-type lectin domain-containing protein n=1 Tax=Labrus bergylta TaxID=56723 RepID=A0A3Q3EQA3_9LABR